jgi:hypothetical protein
MATFLSSVFFAALLQGTPTPAAATVAVRDSFDAPAQVAWWRASLQRLDSYHTRPSHADTVWEHRMLDTADQALARAAAALGVPGSNPEADSARVLRVRVWSERALVTWETGGLARGPDVWGPVPGDLRLSPVLEELGENLLRACPPRGILLTAGDADSYAAWYMRYARGLGADRLVVPFALWRDDPVFRARAAADLKLGPRGSGGGWLVELVEHRAVCVSMGFARLPEQAAKHIKWKTRPLVWVAGPHIKGDPVAARDFVFAAAGMALASRDPWGQAAVAIYGRAARSTPALCGAMATFGIPAASSGCRK